MPASRSFAFICGDDDFLVGRMGQERFDAMVAESGAGEFGREIVRGFAGNGDEVESAVNRFRDAVQTLSLFGGRRVVWLKDVNFLGDSRTGKSETTAAAVEALQRILGSVNPADVGVLVTAAPVDKRRSFYKWCEKNADFAVADDGDAMASVIAAEAAAAGARISPDAVRLLLARVGARNSRLLAEEVRKLASHAAPEGGAPDAAVVIEEADVEEMTPNVSEGEFFETADAFFSGDLRRALAALERHFFTGGDARPVLAALQNRNRLLLQVRALEDSGEARVGPRGVEGLSRAAETYGARFGEALGEKDSTNVFTQNPWYLGKLVGPAKLPSLRRLIDNQQEFLTAFEEIHRRPDENEEVLRELFVRCLA
jgi:DNA polymerase-3 subunit delta